MHNKQHDKRIPTYGKIKKQIINTLNGEKIYPSLYNLTTFFNFKYNEAKKNFLGVECFLISRLEDQVWVTQKDEITIKEFPIIQERQYADEEEQVWPAAIKTITNSCKHTDITEQEEDEFTNHLKYMSTH